MNTEQNKVVILRWIEAGNARNLETAVALWSDDWQDRIRFSLNIFSEAFPDMRITTNDLIAEGDKVVVSWTFHGTHLGTYRDIPATSKAVKWSGIDLYTVADGKITSIERADDALGFLQQLGAKLYWQERVIL